MSETRDNPRARASLRGKGRAILLGERPDSSPEAAPPGTQPESRPGDEPVDPVALALTPEEAEALLDFSPMSPAYQTGLPLDRDDLPAPEQNADDDPLDDDPPLGPHPTARPLDQDDPPPATDSLIPQAPEAPNPGGGQFVQESVALASSRAWGAAGQRSPVPVRPPAVSLFPGTLPPHPDLVDRLVDDERLNRLWDQIDIVQEELIRLVGGDRGPTDVYQQQLLRASSMLLESRANFDDARAIVYRIRSDLSRQRKVTADIIRYRPLLLNYYLGCAIAWVVLMALKQLFVGVAEAIGADIVGALYYPTLFGVAGALISGYVTLDRHTTKLRDFDPIHISWYLFNPLLGGVMGLFTFLLVSLANEDLLQDTASQAELAIAWLVCMVAGMNQNSVFGRLNGLLKRGRGGES